MKRLVILLIMLFPICSFSQTIDWAQTLKAKENDLNILTEIDSDGNVILCGQFSDTLDLDFGTSQYLLFSKGLSDVFIAKYTSDANLIWAISLGGTQQEKALFLEIDNNDNIILSGTLGTNVDFDPSTNDYIVNPDSTASIFNSKIYVAKYSASGEFKWVSHYGSLHAFVDNIGSTIVNQQDDIYINGYTSDTIIITTPFDKDSVASLEGSFLLKFDSIGQLMKKYVLDDITVHEISITEDNKLLTCGYYTASTPSVDFDPDTTSFIMTSSSYYNLFVAKYDIDYLPLWVKTMDSHVSTSYIHTVIPHNNGDFSIYGSFYIDSMNVGFNSNTPFFVDGNSSNGSCFIARYDSTANIKFGKSIIGTKYMSPHCGTVDHNDNLLISGMFEDQIVFVDSGIVNHSFQSTDPNLYWAIYLPNGDLFTAAHFESDACWSSDFAIGINNEIYYTGFFYQSIDVNPSQNNQTILSETGRGLFIVKYHNTIGIGQNNFISTKCYLFPNPVLAGSKINIINDSPINFSFIEIFNINGICVKSSTLYDSNEFMIPTELTPGLYFVRLYEDTLSCHTLKLIVD